MKNETSFAAQTSFATSATGPLQIPWLQPCNVGVDYYAPFIRELDYSHVGHVLAVDPHALLTCTVSNDVGIHALHVMKESHASEIVHNRSGQEQVGRNSS